MRLFDIAEIDPSLALQKAMVARLKADTKLAALGIDGRVYDAVPPKVAFPYIQVGEDLVNTFDGDCTSDTEILSTVRVFSRKLGRVEAKQIAERIRFILTWDSGFEVDDFLMVLGHCEGYQIERHADGLTHQAIIEFRYRLLPLGRRAFGGSILPAVIGAAAGKLKISASAASVIARPALTAAGKLRLAAAGAMLLPALMSTASASVFSPEMLFAASETGAFYDPSDLTSLYQSRTGGANVTAPGQTAGIMLDKSRMGGKTAAEFLAGQAELRQTGAANLVGAPGGTNTYNTATGEATLYRLNGANVGIISFTGTIGKNYSVTLNNTGANSISVRYGGTAVAIIAAGASATVVLHTFTQNLSIWPNSDAASHSFTITSVKEIPGFHAIAPSDAARPLYGREPVTGRRNLLLQSEALNVSPWALTSATLSAGVSDHLGGTAAFTLTATEANGQILQSVGGSLGTGQTYAGSIWIRRRTGSGTVSLFNPNNGGFAALSLTSSWQRLSAVGAGAADTNVHGVRLATSGDAVDIAFAQLETSPTATAYQKVTTALDVTEAGVATRHFLQADGVDDWMQVFPVCNLGETWAHVGGWRSDVDAKYPFTLRSGFRSAIRTQTNAIQARDNGDTAWTEIAAGATNVPHVMTVERLSNAAISGRRNGQAGTTIDPFEDVNTAGLALFSSQNTVFNNGISGRFFGGAWINRNLTTAERRAAEVWQARRTGVAL